MPDRDRQSRRGTFHAVRVMKGRPRAATIATLDPIIDERHA
jgi:hypothetical protein